MVVRNHLTPDRAGRVVSRHRRWPDSSLLVMYMMGSTDPTAEQMAQAVTRDPAAGGAQVRRTHRCDQWRYFPHVATDDIASGFYRDFERLQGTRWTWYTGELPSFPTVNM